MKESSSSGSFLLIFPLFFKEKPVASNEAAGLLIKKALTSTHAVYLHCPRRQRRQEFSGEFRKTAEFGKSNLWFPNSSPEPADASGCRHCLPATPTGVFRRIPENRRIRELQSMVPEFVARTGGGKWVQAQPARSLRTRRPVFSLLTPPCGRENLSGGEIL